MKLLHTADLHIGKRLGEFSLLEEQKHILGQIADYAGETGADAVAITGDVYDKPSPPAEAVALLGGFLSRLAALGKTVFMIGGNHDSPERLDFGKDLFTRSKVYIAGSYRGSLQRVTLADDFGGVAVYLLPYVRPAALKPYFEAESHRQAIGMILGNADIDGTERNILLAHQFVTCRGQTALTSDSEMLRPGGLDGVDADIFDRFDYVALGHLHHPQMVGRPTVRYAGSPLKYSFSEARHPKSVTIIELGEKGRVEVSALPLMPLRDVRELKGPLEELLKLGRREPTEDLLKVILTDGAEAYDAIGRLRTVYPNVLALEFDNPKALRLLESKTAASAVSKPPEELFEEFFINQNNTELTKRQRELLAGLFQKEEAL